MHAPEQPTVLAFFESTMNMSLLVPYASADARPSHGHAGDFRLPATRSILAMERSQTTTSVHVLTLNLSPGTYLAKITVGDGVMHDSDRSITKVTVLASALQL